MDAATLPYLHEKGNPISDSFRTLSRALTNVESYNSVVIYVHACVFGACQTHISARSVRLREAIQCAFVCPQCSLFYFFFFIAAFFMALFFIALFFFIDFFIDLAMMFECGGL